MGQDRWEIPSDVSATGAHCLTVFAKARTLVCVCQFLIPHPWRNDPAGKLRFQRENLNTSGLGD